MNVKKAYDQWATQYDSQENKTRDLERTALRDTIKELKPTTCLEAGCGTGKNTTWLSQKAGFVLAVDLSEKMLATALQKKYRGRVEFKQADLNKKWLFTKRKFDLVVFSLVLEHIKNIEPVFKKAVASLKGGGYIYIGELHPSRQYKGTKARFKTGNSTRSPQCYTHHISDFTDAAKKCGLSIVILNEYFDAGDQMRPRILTILFRKK